VRQSCGGVSGGGEEGEDAQAVVELADVRDIGGEERGHGDSGEGQSRGSFMTRSNDPPVELRGGRAAAQKTSDVVKAA
jgi:hypothetical protein